MTPQDALAQAEMAYHNLMIGQLAEVVVDQNGERVTFTRATAWRLMQYIQDLKRQLGIAGTTGPLRPFF